jgi:hypothetical protein
MPSPMQGTSYLGYLKRVILQYYPPPSPSTNYVGTACDWENDWLAECLLQI